tara:strand:+ start:100 stop:276 length:177 start_codon:yes stop_codon:yes gene_type:complete
MTVHIEISYRLSIEISGGCAKEPKTPIWQLKKVKKLMDPTMSITCGKVSFVSKIFFLV